MVTRKPSSDLQTNKRLSGALSVPFQFRNFAVAKLAVLAILSDLLGSVSKVTCGLHGAYFPVLSKQKPEQSLPNSSLTTMLALDGLGPVNGHGIAA